MTLRRQLLLGLPLLATVGIGGAVWVRNVPDRQMDAALEDARVLRVGEEWRSPIFPDETSVTTNLRFEGARLEDIVAQARRCLPPSDWREVGTVQGATPDRAVAFIRDGNGDWASLTHRYRLLRKIFPRHSRMIRLYPWSGGAVGVDKMVAARRWGFNRPGSDKRISRAAVSVPPALSRR